MALKRERLPFFTIGHSTRTIAEFASLLKVAEVRIVVDIRTVRRSRNNPQFNGDSLPASLSAFALDYDHIGELGGLRKRAEVPAAVNGFWENQSFHNYADYALSPSFRLGLEKLRAIGRARRCAIMCSEAVWWRCHRRIVADHLLGLGETVFHLMGKDRIEKARMTQGAALAAGDITYPARPEP